MNLVCYNGKKGEYSKNLIYEYYSKNNSGAYLSSHHHSRCLVLGRKKGANSIDSDATREE